jgi:hypothetical protein
MLNIWPKLPVYVSYNDSLVVEDTDNAITALKLKGSISGINLTVDEFSAVWEDFLAVMQGPFPILEDFKLRSYDLIPVIPDSFLGGSAPRLRRVTLVGITFLALPNLLVSCHQPFLPRSLGYSTLGVHFS